MQAIPLVYIVFGKDINQPSIQQDLQRRRWRLVNGREESPRNPLGEHHIPRQIRLIRRFQP